MFFSSSDEWKRFILHNTWALKALFDRGFEVKGLEVTSFDVIDLMVSLFGQNNFLMQEVNIVPPAEYRDTEKLVDKYGWEYEETAWAISYYLERPQYDITIRIPQLAQLHGLIAEKEYADLLQVLRNACGEKISLNTPFEELAKKIDEYGDIFFQEDLFEKVEWLKEPAKGHTVKVVGVIIRFVDFNPNDGGFWDYPPHTLPEMSALIKFWDKIQELVKKKCEERAA